MIPEGNPLAPGLVDVLTVPELLDDVLFVASTSFDLFPANSTRLTTMIIPTIFPYIPSSSATVQSVISEPIS